MPLVSVIMPVCNMAAESGILQKAVDSVKNQTCRDWELLLCDDGSADHTLQVIRRLARTDARIRVLYSHKNHKAGWARNACIRAAKGRYIAVMDADDIADPERLEIQTDFLDRHPEYAFAGSNAWLIDSRGIWGLRRTEEKPDGRSFLRTLPFVHPSVVLRTEAVRAVHGYRQTPAFYRVEDYEFLMRLYGQGYRGCNIQKPLLYYREDARAYQRRKYRYRIAECRMRYQGFKALGILHGSLCYVIKPLAVGLVPSFVMRAIRFRQFRIKNPDVLSGRSGLIGTGVRAEKRPQGCGDCTGTVRQVGSTGTGAEKTAARLRGLHRYGAPGGKYRSRGSKDGCKAAGTAQVPGAVQNGIGG